jgi:exopolysaccharide production protein ExoY
MTSAHDRASRYPPTSVLLDNIVTHGSRPARDSVHHIQAVDNLPIQSATIDRSIDMTAVLWRVLDILLATLLLIFALPLMIFIAVAIKIMDPGPIFFSHRRIGRGGIYFPCHKFRSMVVDSDRKLAELLERDSEARACWQRHRKLVDDPRITPLGRFLRASSLDELPQIWNVLTGEMSLVGPRPIVDAEIIYYGRYFDAYRRVRPGITGLWQVSGRSNTSYRRRVALDVVFAREQSIKLYIFILLKTIPATAMARGAH